MVSQEIQKQIDELDARKAQLLATAHRDDVFSIVKKAQKDDKITDDDMYPAFKAFTNHVERQRKVANLEEARKKKAEKGKEQEGDSGAPVS